MKIINGKWKDEYEDNITVFNYGKLQEIGNNLVNLYGEEITYNRINLISSIKNLSIKQENDLVFILNNPDAISKLAGY
jgi:hypothetical protein